jgi:hypothetical protein
LIRGRFIRNDLESDVLSPSPLQKEEKMKGKAAKFNLTGITFFLITATLITGAVQASSYEDRQKCLAACEYLSEKTNECDTIYNYGEGDKRELYIKCKTTYHNKWIKCKESCSE